MQKIETSNKMALNKNLLSILPLPEVLPALTKPLKLIGGITFVGYSLSVLGFIFLFLEAGNPWIFWGNVSVAQLIMALGLLGGFVGLNGVATIIVTDCLFSHYLGITDYFREQKTHESRSS